MASDTQPTPRRKKSPRSKPTFSAGHYFLLVALAGAGLLVMTDKVEPFVDYLYRPYSLVILIVIGAMYLLQKGSDRSRVYRLELLAMRRRRVEYLQFHRDIADQLEGVSRQIREVSRGSSQPAPQNLKAAQAELDKAIEELRDQS
jgi:hypothetical protein